MKRVTVLAIFSGVLLFGYEVSAQIISAASGVWSSEATWTSGVVPGELDKAIISAGHTVTVDQNTSCKDLDIRNGSTLSVDSSVALSVSGSLTLVNLPNASVTGTITGEGSVTTAYLVVGSNTEITLDGIFTHNLTSTVNSLTILVNVMMNSIRSLDTRISNSMFTIASGTVIVNGPINSFFMNSLLKSTVTMAGGAQDAVLVLNNDSPFNIIGTGTTNIILNGTSSTVVYGRGGAQTVRPTPYTNLMLDGSGSKTVTGASVSGKLSIRGTATAAGTIPAYGAGSSIEYKGSSQQTTGIELGSSFGGTGGLIIDNSHGVSLNGNKTITQAVNIAEGSVLDAGSYTVSAGTWNNSGTVNFSGASNGLAIPSGTVEYSGGAQIVTPGTYNNLTVSGSGIKTIGGNTTVNGVLTASNSVLDNGEYTLIVDSRTQRSLYQAWANELIEQPQVYNGTEFVPIEPDTFDSLGTWEGFYISAKRDLNVYFLSNPDSSVSPANISKTLEPGRWHMISSPLDPGGGRDAKASLSAPPSQLAAEDYTGGSGDLWRIYKWAHDKDAFNEHSAGSLEQLVPGRGFWLRHKYDGARDVAVNGSGVTTSDGYYKLKLPLVAGFRNTWHQIGNPYSYPVKWSDVKFSDPLGEGFALGKTAALLSPSEAETCHIRLGVVSNDGTARDTYNRAGIVLSERGNADVFDVTELTAPGAGVGLFLTDPSNPDRRALAYDYRAHGEDVYTWEVNLLAYGNSMDATLSVNEFQNVPDGMVFTLTDPVTNEIHVLSGNDDIPVTLANGESKTMILAASMTDEFTSVETSTPLFYEITGVYPNPFNPTVTIDFDIGSAGNVQIRIYNINGQIVETLVSGYLDGGQHKIIWNASGHSSGVYVLTMESHGKRISKFITLMK